MSTERATQSPTAVEAPAEPHDRDAAASISRRAQTAAVLRAGLARLRRLVGRKRLLEIRKRLAGVDLDRPRRVVVASWLAGRRWRLANTFSPAWVPHRWDLPRVAYAVAVLSQLAAALLTLLIAHFSPALVYPDPLVILTIVLVAWNCGAAPGLVATVVGAFLLNELVVPRFAASALHRGGTSSAVVILLVGLVVSVAASHSERARRHAEDLAVDTERARLDADALRARLDAIIDAMADGVTVHDNLGNLLRANRAGRELFELDDWPADSASRPIDERLAALSLLDDQGRPFAPEHAPLFRILRGEVLTGTDAVDMIRPMRDGRQLLLSLSGAPIRNTSRHIIGAVTITRDVTERRRLERRTQDALNALLAMAEALVLAPGETEPELAADLARESPSMGGVAYRLATLTRNLLGCQRVGIVSLEPETETLHPLAVAGFSSEQERQWWTEQPAEARLHDIAEPPIVARLRAGQMALLDLRESPPRNLPNPYGASTVLVAPMRLGQTLVGILSLDHDGAAHVYTPDEMALAGAVAELTALVIERERLLHDQAEARARELALHEATRRMNEFLAIASHELKTPVTVIKTNVQVIARRLNGRVSASVSPDDLERLVEQAPTLLRRVEQQTDRLTRLVEDLLDVTRIQAGKLEMRPTRCNLAAVVEERVEEQRQAHPTRTITLTLPDGPPALVVADPERIGQVVTNYLTNALKYSKADRPVAIRVEVAGQSARVSVRDEGPGVPAEEHERVWERFHRVAGIEVLSGSGVGLGLGLHICRTIVERHEGAVGLESALGRGSTFWFTLPLAPGEDEDKAEEAAMGAEDQRS